MRWNLFTGASPCTTTRNPSTLIMPGNHCPKLVSGPSIHPLPLRPTGGSARTSWPRALAIASTLLSLQSNSSSHTHYPPTRPNGPHLQTSPSGQVSVVLDPSVSKNGRNRSSPQPQGQGQGQGKTDWIVILEFEAGVEQGSDRHFRKVSLFSFS
jgi:hypothetical protein